MVAVAREMQRRSMAVPLLIGGATTSAKHTAVKIAPCYDQCVAHVLDASRSVGVVERLINPKSRSEFEAENRSLQNQLAASFARRQAIELTPFIEARQNRFTCDWANVNIPTPQFSGLKTLNDYSLDELRSFIDWSPFFLTWELKGKYPKIFDDPERGAEARQLFDDAQRLLDRIVSESLLHAHGVYGFWPAASNGEDIIVYADETRSKERCRLHGLRQQWRRKGQETYLSLADFVAPIGAKDAEGNSREDFIGAFAVTAGVGCQELAASFEADHDDYNSILSKALADRLAEAFAEALHVRVRREWGFAESEPISKEELIAEKYRGIRPAPGYPAQPDHSEKTTLFELLDAQRQIGVELTESLAMNPAASVCGLYLAHPQAKYFAVDRLGKDQIRDYARRKGAPIEVVERWLAPNLGYDPE